ncbi:MAG: bifunctional tetrahydrofolate synthase/dihydrofolate synthase [Betaproteobacteria bacterium]
MALLPEWLAYLESLHPKGEGGIELGLERVNRVKAELQQKQSCPLIIVGGTNGKGSTCAYLEAIYTFAGYKVGCYTSPHLLEYNERIRVDRVMVDDETLCRAFAKVEAARKSADNSPLTYFEFGTLAAWEVFAEHQVEIIILEVGLGGRLDAVNAYDADCAIVTGIALDHTDWLGTTRESIGFEKAGIYRQGKPALCADPEPPQSLLDHAATIGAGLRLLGRDFGYFGDKTQWTYWQRDPSSGLDASGSSQDNGALTRRGGLANPSLRGACQLRNASAVLTAIETLKERLPVSMQAIRRGLMEPELKGRFQVIPGRPVMVLDVAHNPQALAVLSENLGDMGFFEKTYAVVGMLADKDIAGALVALAGKVDVWLVASLEVPRGASAEVLAAVIVDGKLGGEVECCASPEDAFMRAAKRAGENDRILTFGSFYTVAAVMRAMKHKA